MTTPLHVCVLSVIRRAGGTAGGSGVGGALTMANDRQRHSQIEGSPQCWAPLGSDPVGGAFRRGWHRLGARRHPRSLVYLGTGQRARG